MSSPTESVLPGRSYQKKNRMFNIKKVRPLFTGIVTTANKYVGDITSESGLILTDKMEGGLNVYQTVVSVGAMCKDIKEGNIVCLNYKRYLVPKHLPGKIENNIQSDNLSGTYEIPMIRINGKDYLFLQTNDVEYIVEDYDGVDEGGLLQ